MKLIRHLCLVAVVVAASGLLASCYWNPQSGAGSITLKIAGPATRSITAPTAVSYARAFLYTDNGNTLVNLGGSVPYAEGTVSGGSGTMTVENVPAGPQYSLVLVLGDKDSTTGVFLPGSYTQTSSTFTVTANAQNTVALSAPTTVTGIGATGATVGVTYDLLGDNLNGLTVANGSVATSTSGTLFRATGSGVPTAYTSTMPGGTINSLSAVAPTPSSGTTEVWMNTSAGIVPTTAVPAGGPTSGVLQSATYTAIYSTTSFYPLLYRYDGGLGGTVYSSILSTPVWVNIPFSGSASPAVFDLATHAPSATPYQNAYVASARGAFGMSYTLLASANTTLSTLLGQAGFFTVTDSSGNSPTINALSVDDFSALLYVGTNNGVYTTAISNVDNVVGTGSTYRITSAALTGTPGHAFRKVVTINAGNYSEWAGLSEDAVYYGHTGSTVTRIPIAAVSLGAPREIALLLTGSVYLVIAGSEGLSFVPIG